MSEVERELARGIARRLLYDNAIGGDIQWQLEEPLTQIIAERRELEDAAELRGQATMAERAATVAERKQRTREAINGNGADIAGAIARDIRALSPSPYFLANREREVWERIVGVSETRPLNDCLNTLLEWAKHLLDVHNCDCHGWEVLHAAIDATKLRLAALEAARDTDRFSGR